MTKKILIVGISGRMGEIIYSRLSDESSFECSAGYDVKKPGFETGIPVSSNIEELIGSCDLLVDFSQPQATMSVIDECVDNKKGMVIGTTGYTDEETARLKSASQSIPILLSYNMSPGISMMKRLVGQMAGFMRDSYDIEIVEKHHKMKKDAPSGTAYMLGEEAAKQRNRDLPSSANFGRKGESKRKNGEITFHSLRGGSVIGEHDVYFIGSHDQITISHTAFDRAAFTEGVVLALKFIQDKKQGWFSMDDVIGTAHGL